ncbi:MAG: aminodeoxychorismate/anthranilate synthase component II [Desulfobacteraceae bacterium]|nr:aminodeoxychorismate/anthranilate synthase component II [Desulfobacteraceae bacterium]
MLTAVIDNYDSFTFNLVHYILHTGSKVEVFRNDQTSINELKELNPDAIVISPGPGRPENAGISLDVVKIFSGKVPLLGVCLGHQVIASCFGGNITHAKTIMHGKTSTITADGKTIFHGIKSPFSVMRYHSLAVSKQGFPECLSITCETKNGEIMGLRHKKHQTEGVQFHPESFMTIVGKRLIRNFIKGI